MSIHSNGDTESAASCVLSIPMIVSDILQYISASSHQSMIPCPAHKFPSKPSIPRNKDLTYVDWADPGFPFEHEESCTTACPSSRTGILFPCLFVNHLFFVETARLLWRTTQDGYWLSYLMSRITPSRRQMYANWIEFGIERSALDPVDYYTKFGPVQEGFNPSLQDLSFPRLKAMHIDVDGPYLPEIPGQNVETVVLLLGSAQISTLFDPTGGLEAQVWKKVSFDAIAASFLNARHMCINSRCIGYEVEELEMLWEKMPKLETFDYRYLPRAFEDWKRSRRGLTS